MTNRYDDITLESLEVGAAPIVRRFLDRLQFEQLLARHLPPTTRRPEVIPTSVVLEILVPTSSPPADPSTDFTIGLSAASRSTSASRRDRPRSSATTASDALLTAFTAPTERRCSPPSSCAPCASSTSVSARCTTTPRR